MHAEIVLAGPRKNAMSSRMLRFLLERLREAGGAPVLLRGEGDALSSGLDEVSEDALGAAKAKLESLAALPRDAYAAVKGDLRKPLPYDAEAERLLREAMPFWTSEAFRARLAAALKK